MDEKRKEIKEDISFYGIDIEKLLSGSLEECAQKILDIPKELHQCGRKIDQYTHFVLEPYIRDSDGDLTIYGIRLETNEERDSRIALEQRRNRNAQLAAEKIAKLKEIEERRLLAELKKKYPEQ